VTLRTDKKYWLDIAVFKNQQKLPYLQSKHHIKQLVEIIRNQINERSIRIVFYGPSPKMMKCYLKVLHYAFDRCSQPHSWIDLIEHVKNRSRTIKVIHRIGDVVSLKENFSLLAEFTQQIVPKAKFEDIVLPKRQKKQLRDIITFEAQRIKLYEEWNFRQHSETGLGISVLFVGPYDIGKTKAAEVLAEKLKLPMYRIDLSQVVNKYVGETEKNLMRLFDVAEMSDRILFFDEADAIFGRRTEVRDRNDHYVNISNYLLQRLESYRGLAILAINKEDDIDSAFVRRVRFIVDFPSPDFESRPKIWKRVLKKNVRTRKKKPDVERSQT